MRHKWIVKGLEHQDTCRPPARGQVWSELSQAGKQLADVERPTQTRANRSYLFRACCSTESASIASAGDSKAGREGGSLTVNKREGFRDAETGSWWHGEAGGGPTRSRARQAGGMGTNLTFSGWKPGQKTRKLVVSDQVLTI